MSVERRARASVRVASRSAAETQALGAALASLAHPGDRIALHGRLGAGKTQFAKGFAIGLGVRDPVLSPTFTLMAEYAGRLPLFHLDLYRLAGDADAFEAGLLDEREAEGVTVIEWGEGLSRALDPERLEITIEIPREAAEGEVQPRLLELRAGSARYEPYVARAGAWAAERNGRAPASG